MAHRERERDTWCSFGSQHPIIWQSCQQSRSASSCCRRTSSRKRWFLGGQNHLRVVQFCLLSFRRRWKPMPKIICLFVELLAYFLGLDCLGRQIKITHLSISSNSNVNISVGTETNAVDETRVVLGGFLEFEWGTLIVIRTNNSCWLWSALIITSSNNKGE